MTRTVAVSASAGAPVVKTRVLDRVLAGLVGCEVAQQVAGREGERVGRVDETTEAGSSVGRPPAGEMSFSSTGMSIWAPARTTTVSSTAMGASSGAGGSR